MSDIRTGKQVSDLDQLMAGVDDLAKTISEYRNNLIKYGIPENVADEMAKEASRLFWLKTTGAKHND